MDEAYALANRNIEKSDEYNKSKYDQKHANCVELKLGDRVLVKNVRPKGTTMTGKLASFWEQRVYEVVETFPGYPTFVIRELGVKDGKCRKLHRNLLKRVNELAPPSTEPIPAASSVAPAIVSAPSAVVNDTTVIVDQPLLPPLNTVSSKKKSTHRRRERRRAKVNDTAPRVIVESDDSESDDGVVVVTTRTSQPAKDGIGGLGTRMADLAPGSPPPPPEVIDVQGDELVIADEDEVSVADVDDSFHSVGEEVVDEIEIPEVVDEIETPEVEEDETEVVEDANETTDATVEYDLDDSLDLEETPPPPPRRVRTRPSRPPKMLTYEQMGRPVYKERRSRR